MPNYRKNVTNSQNFDTKCLIFDIILAYFPKIMPKNLPNWHYNMPAGDHVTSVHEHSVQHSSNQENESEYGWLWLFAYKLFQMLPSGKRPRSIRSETKRTLDRFDPFVIHILTKFDWLIIDKFQFIFAWRMKKIVICSLYALCFLAILFSYLCRIKLDEYGYEYICICRLPSQIQWVPNTLVQSQVLF